MSTFMPLMALLDIQKIKINTIVHGANCPVCKGELVPTKLKSVPAKLLGVLSLGVLKIHNYKCTNCEKEFNLF